MHIEQRSSPGGRAAGIFSGIPKATTALWWIPFQKMWKQTWTGCWHGIRRRRCAISCIPAIMSPWPRRPSACTSWPRKRASLHHLRASRTPAPWDRFQWGSRSSRRCRPVLRPPAWVFTGRVIFSPASPWVSTNAGGRSGGGMPRLGAPWRNSRRRPGSLPGSGAGRIFTCGTGRRRSVPRWFPWRLGGGRVAEFRRPRGQDCAWAIRGQLRRGRAFPRRRS